VYKEQRLRVSESFLQLPPDEQASIYCKRALSSDDLAVATLRRSTGVVIRQIEDVAGLPS
jgi:hypothetical protein